MRKFANNAYLGGICKWDLGPSNSIKNLKFLYIVYPDEEFYWMDFLNSVMGLNFAYKSLIQTHHKFFSEFVI